MHGLEISKFESESHRLLCATCHYWNKLNDIICATNTNEYIIKIVSKNELQLRQWRVRLPLVEV